MRCWVTIRCRPHTAAQVAVAEPLRLTFCSLAIRTPHVIYPSRNSAFVGHPKRLYGGARMPQLFGWSSFSAVHGARGRDYLYYRSSKYESALVVGVALPVWAREAGGVEEAEADSRLRPTRCSSR